MDRFVVKLEPKVKEVHVPLKSDSENDSINKRPRLEEPQQSQQLHSGIDMRPTSTSNINTGLPDKTSAAPPVIIDISIDCSSGPTQPRTNFPRRVISGNSRSFKSIWYDKFSWLEYSITKDAVFCFYCRHFLVQKSHDVLINTGYNDWKNIGKMCDKHETSNSHKMCISKYKGWIDSKKTGAVTTKINDQIAKEIEKNRECLKSIVRSALFCARQNIALRGHREVKARLPQVEQKGTPDSSDDSEEEESGEEDNTENRELEEESKKFAS